jgi:hypothetical protein
MSFSLPLDMISLPGLGWDASTIHGLLPIWTIEPDIEVIKSYHASTLTSRKIKNVRQNSSVAAHLTNCTQSGASINPS